MTFFNIFSKKKESPSINELKILVDYREKNSLIPSELSSLGFQIEFKHLPIADYLINNIAIERKTISDFKSSIINKRIFEQIKNLQQYPKYLLIIEGVKNEDIYTFGMHENAFRGSLLSMSLEYRIPIIFSQDEKDTAKYLSILAKKKPSSETSIRASRILMPKSEQQQFILEGFPHVGPIKAKKLLDKFKSLKNIFNASEEDLKQILGKRAKNFKSLLD